MGYAIDCHNCSNRFNPNNHDLCPKCKTRPERVDVLITSTPQGSPTRKKREMGAFGWYLVLFVVFGLIGGLLTMNDSPDISNPNSGYDAEWEAENSIDGPAGAFDDQSKP